MVTSVVLILVLSLLLVSARTDVGAFFGAGGGSVELIVSLTLAAFLISILVSLVVRVQYAVGQQSSSNLWQTAGSLTMFAGIWGAARFTEWPGWFILAASFLPVFVAVINSLWFFGFTPIGKGLRPAPRLADWDVARSLLALGSRFLLVSLLLAASVATDPWIVARTANLAEVPNFAIPSRLLSVVGLISVMALMPLWPMHARAVREGDIAWIQRVTLRLCIISTASITLIVSLVLASAQLIVDRWLGGAITVDYWMWAGFAVLCVAQAATGPLFMVQNGAEILGPQTRGYALLFGTVPLKWWLASHVGYEWIPWVSSGAYLMFVMPAAVVGYRRAVAIAGTRAEERVT
jgi:O-antigen/teichoic acid export membrane protein